VHPCSHVTGSVLACTQILVSLGVFGLLGPKVGTEQVYFMERSTQTFVHKGLCTNPSFPLSFWPFGAKSRDRTAQRCICAQMFV